MDARDAGGQVRQHRAQAIGDLDHPSHLRLGGGAASHRWFVAGPFAVGLGLRVADRVRARGLEPGSRHPDEDDGGEHAEAKAANVKQHERRRLVGVVALGKGDADGPVVAALERDRPLQGATAGAYGAREAGHKGYHDL